jgi:predicted phage tail protein
MDEKQQAKASSGGLWRTAPQALQASVAFWAASILVNTIVPAVRSWFFGDSGGSIVMGGLAPSFFFAAWLIPCNALLLRGWGPARYILTLLGGLTLLGVLQPLTPQIVIGLIVTGAALVLMWTPPVTAFVKQRAFRIG